MTSTIVKAGAAGHGQHRHERRAAPVAIVASGVPVPIVASGVPAPIVASGVPVPIVASGARIQHRHKRRVRPLSLVTAMVAHSTDSDDAAASTPASLPIVANAESIYAISSPEPALPSGNHRQSQRGHQVRRLGTKSGAGVFHTIINQMPPHRVYIEPFVGWASIMKAKLPADRNIGIDINSDRISQARLELPTAELTMGDGIRFLQNFRWQGGELVYCDPPYLLETRTSRARYEFEISDHGRLLEVLLRLPCPVIVSGYHSTLYSETLRAWRTVKFTGQTRGGPRTEYLWCNFPEPVELHDYRYLGRDFRERQRIKRKIQRWTNKLSGMATLERQAVMAAIRNVHHEESQTAGHARSATFPTMP